MAAWTRRGRVEWGVSGLTRDRSLAELNKSRVPWEGQLMV